MRVLISVCGEGFGHTTRCLAIGDALKNDYEIAYLAYGKSKDFIESYGYKVYETYPEIKLKGKDGKFDIKSTLFNKEHSPKKAIRRELKVVKEFKPDLIITDCKYSTAVIGKLLKIPVFCISNQNYTKYKIKTDVLVYPTMAILNLINKRCEKFLVPDFPMPYTICQYNIKPIENLEYLGPLIRYDVDNVYDDGYILSVIGGFEYRYKILESLAKLAKKNGYNVKLVCGSYDVAKKLKSKFNERNIDIIPITKNMDELMRGASLIVSHGGHSTIMESLCFGKPLIVIPDMDHPEQCNNAKKVHELKCGIALSYKDLDRLDYAIEEIKNNSLYRKNAEHMRDLYYYYNGKENIKKIIDNFFNKNHSKKFKVKIC